jgi:hypothetical protein
MSPPTETQDLTRKQRREQARAERKALEEKARAQAARRKMLTRVGAGAIAVIAVVAVAVAALGGGSGHKAASTSQAGAGSGATAGLQTSPGPWSPEYNNLAVRLQALNLPNEANTYHVHAALRVYVNGKQITVPASIGIDPQGQFLAPLHTHDTSGVVHMEASQAYPFTLTQFFTIWGVKFTNSQLGGNVAGSGKTLSMYVNGKLVPNPAGYVMKPHDDIVVGYGKPGSFPTSFKYDWATAGL